ncbi:MAG: hypothetical protein WCJ64_27090, partial [Rhodospirillaceae bacterium]
AYKLGDITFKAGIDNIFNKVYYDPLGGVDIKDGRYDNHAATFPFPSVPGMGRSFNVGMTVKF